MLTRSWTCRAERPAPTQRHCLFIWIKHKSKLDEIAAGRQGLVKVSLPAAKRITVGQLLDDLKTDIALRELKSAYKVQSHMRQGL